MHYACFAANCGTMHSRELLLLFFHPTLVMTLCLHQTAGHFIPPALHVCFFYVYMVVLLHGFGPKTHCVIRVYTLEKCKKLYINIQYFFHRPPHFWIHSPAMHM